MSQYTPVHALPYPEGDDDVAVHSDVEALARKVESSLLTLDHAVNERISDMSVVHVGGARPDSGWWIQLPKIADDFNRTDTSPGGTLGVTSSGGKPWYDYDSMYRISSGKLVSNTGLYSMADVETYSPNSEVSADFEIVRTAGLRFGVTARHDGSEVSYYSAYIHADESTMYLFRSNAPGGGTHILWSGPVNITDRTYWIGLRTVEENNQTRLTVLLDGDDQATYLDDRSDRPQGARFGIRLNRISPYVAVDNFTTTSL